MYGVAVEGIACRKVCLVRRYKQKNVNCVRVCVRVCMCLYADDKGTSEGILGFVVWRTYCGRPRRLLELLLFETLYLDVSSPAITFAVQLMVVMHRSEVVAVAAG